MREVILELLGGIDLLVVWGTIGAVAAKSAMAKIPIVFLSVGAPVEIGLVETLARPGGNMTGITFEAASETYAKRLQMLKDLVRNLSCVAVLGAKDDPNVRFAKASLDSSAPKLGIAVVSSEVASPDEFGRAFEDMRRLQSQALIVVAGAFTLFHRKAIVDLALSNGLPSCHGFAEAVAAGGLISLGPDMIELAYQGARLAAKVIDGAHPADLPVEQPTRYTVSVNLETAKALGLAIPPTILARADEVIE